MHVWSIGITATPDILEYLNSLLSLDELYRARAFRFDRDRTAFIVAHGVLRLLLARHSGISPRAVRYCYGPNGKPSLAPEQDNAGICFNISHSKNLVACALSTTSPVGIDVEAVRALRGAHEIAQRFFAPGEYQELMAINPTHFVRAFLVLWTRKEAYVKATGEGLSRDPRGVRVSLVPGVTRAWVEEWDANYDAAAWYLHDISLGPSYVGAVAIQDKNAVLMSHYSESPGAFIEDLAASRSSPLFA